MLDGDFDFDCEEELLMAGGVYTHYYDEEYAPRPYSNFPAQEEKGLLQRFLDWSQGK